MGTKSFKTRAVNKLNYLLCTVSDAYIYISINTGATGNVFKVL